MPEYFVETQDLRVEIDTEDDDLGNHTNRRVYYIYTDPDGVAAEPAYKEGNVTDTSVMYADLDPLEAGTYDVWAESDNAGGKHCVSAAGRIPADARGTVRV